MGLTRISTPHSGVAGVPSGRAPAKYGEDTRRARVKLDRNKPKQNTVKRDSFPITTRKPFFVGRTSRNYTASTCSWSNEISPCHTARADFEPVRTDLVGCDCRSRQAAWPGRER